MRPTLRYLRPRFHLLDKEARGIGEEMTGTKKGGEKNKEGTDTVE